MSAALSKELQYLGGSASAEIHFLRSWPPPRWAEIIHEQAHRREPASTTRYEGRVSGTGDGMDG